MLTLTKSHGHHWIKPRSAPVSLGILLSDLTPIILLECWCHWLDWFRWWDCLHYCNTFYVLISALMHPRHSPMSPTGCKHLQQHSHAPQVPWNHKAPAQPPWVLSPMAHSSAHLLLPKKPLQWSATGVGVLWAQPRLCWGSPTMGI